MKVIFAQKSPTHQFPPVPHNSASLPPHPSVLGQVKQSLKSCYFSLTGNVKSSILVWVINDTMTPYLVAPRGPPPVWPFVCVSSPASTLEGKPSKERNVFSLDIVQKGSTPVETVFLANKTEIRTFTIEVWILRLILRFLSSLFYIKTGIKTKTDTNISIQYRYL